MPKVKQSTNDKPTDMGQKDASQVASADDKTSNRRTSDRNRRAAMVKFVSADGETFYVTEEVARKFIFKGKRAEHAVREVYSDVLALMIKWAEHHVDEPEPDSSDEEVDDGDKSTRIPEFNEWEREFLDIHKNTLLNLLGVVQDTEMKGLVNLVCKKVGSELRGMNSDEMRRFFNIDKERPPEWN